MNFTELTNELAARGFDYLSATRLGRYINLARAELDDLDLWLYRKTTASGAAPLTIADLDTVDTVVFNGSALAPAEQGWLTEAYGDLTTTGTPNYWYRTATGIGVYPANTGTITVVYWKVPTDIATTQTPLAPDRYHNIIVDMAVRMAYRDADNHEAAEALQVQIDRDTLRMRMALGLDTQSPLNGVTVTESW